MAGDLIKLIKKTAINSQFIYLDVSPVSAIIFWEQYSSERANSVSCKMQTTGLISDSGNKKHKK